MSALVAQMVSRVAAKTANITVRSANFADSAAISVPTFGECKLPSPMRGVGARRHKPRLREQPGFVAKTVSDQRMQTLTVRTR